MSDAEWQFVWSVGRPGKSYTALDAINALINQAEPDEVIKFYAIDVDEDNKENE